MRIVRGWTLKAGTGENSITFNVTIPAKAGKQLGINKADTVYVTLEENNNIKVSKVGEGKGRSVMLCGNSLAITIPKEIQDLMGLENGDCFIVELREDSLFYRKIEG